MAQGLNSSVCEGRIDAMPDGVEEFRGKMKMSWHMSCRIGEMGIRFVLIQAYKTVSDGSLAVF